MLFGLMLMALVGYLIISLASLIYVGRADLSKKVYAATGTLCGFIFMTSVWPRGAEILTIELPLGVPWIGMHLRIDQLSTFFLAVINLVSAAASVYAIGYGAHERHPMRILPFFPLFIAAMNLVVLADDAFTFLWAWARCFRGDFQFWSRCLGGKCLPLNVGWPRWPLVSHL